MTSIRIIDNTLIIDNRTYRTGLFNQPDDIYEIIVGKKSGHIRRFNGSVESLGVSQVGYYNRLRDVVIDQYSRGLVAIGPRGLVIRRLSDGRTWFDEEALSKAPPNVDLKEELPRGAIARLYVPGKFHYVINESLDRSAINTPWKLGDYCLSQVS